MSDNQAGSIICHGDDEPHNRGMPRLPPSPTNMCNRLTQQSSTLAGLVSPVSLSLTLSHLLFTLRMRTFRFGRHAPVPQRQQPHDRSGDDEPGRDSEGDQCQNGGIFPLPSGKRLGQVLPGCPAQAVAVRRCSDREYNTTYFLQYSVLSAGQGVLSCLSTFFLVFYSVGYCCP